MKTGNDGMPAITKERSHIPMMTTLVWFIVQIYRAFNGNNMARNLKKKIKSI
jgi:hypothetical protein